MDVSCPACLSRFRIDPAKVPVGGVHARCSVCGSIISVQRTELAGGRDARAEDHPASPQPPSSTLPVHEPAPAFELETVRAEGDPALVPSPSQATGAGSGPLGFEVSGEPTSVLEVPTNASMAQLPPIAAAPPRAEDPPAPSAGLPGPLARAAQPRLAPRRVNPYLSNDPAQKARRLARALVSDLVAYNPEKREDGLRAGTLRELFRDEIRKSWQEYVEQVGAAVAESTPHFQDALNDILAGGRRIF